MSAEESPQGGPSPAEPIKLLYSAKEAAGALDIDTKTLRAHVRAGDIRYVLIGTGQKKQHRKYTRSDLEEFIESRREVPVLGTSRMSRGSGASTSSSQVIGFTELRARRLKSRRET